MEGTGGEAGTAREIRLASVIDLGFLSVAFCPFCLLDFLSISATFKCADILNAGADANAASQSSESATSCTYVPCVEILIYIPGQKMQCDAGTLNPLAPRTWGSTVPS